MKAFIPALCFLLFSCHQRSGSDPDLVTADGRRVWAADASSLDERTIANDVWHWYDVNGIKPIGLRRVTWEKDAAFETRWGYYIFYKGILFDSELKQELESKVSSFVPYSGIPRWAVLVPQWWDPELMMPEDVSKKLIGRSEGAYLQKNDDGFTIFWIKRPLDDATLHRTR